ncbi:fasciclin domain-containing protein [Colletotrichum scovillei]|uniref:fasciclin domain-containing protein n=1 Tax=Colletotrichum scovillei TaxID=1209932 RepID=UPI0015C386E0|nr:fasciclin domain-containing protein [Colletotrichum scovillei]KAF4778996.1 fasciclin domain-containing protein [Colletotrichum scovillei]
MIGSEYFPMGRRIHIRFNSSTSLRRKLSEKLIRHVRSSSVDSSPSSSAAAALISDTKGCEDMKASCVLPYAAVATSVSAFALPETRPEQSTVRTQDGSSRDSSWDTTRAWSDGKSSSLGDVVNAIGGMFYQAAGAMAQAGRRVMGQPTDAHDIETGHAGPVVLQQITSDDPRSSQEADKGKDLLALIKESGMQTEYFTTLLTSYGKAHDMLLGNNDENTQKQEQFTVFVPVDSAFQKLEGVFELSRAELLGEILEYHILPGRYTYKNLRGLRTAETILEEGGGGELGQQRVRIAEGPSGVEINFYARVLAPESRESGDGAVVVHFIDEVLIPPPRWDVLVGTAVPEETLGTFAKAMKRSGASEEVLRSLRGGSGVTVFAPSNEAWDKLGEEAMDFLFSSREGAQFLEALVRYHFVAEVVYTDFFKGVEMDEEEMEEKTDGGRDLGEDADGVGRVRRDVQTLLDGARVSIEAVVSRSAGRTGDGGRPVGVVRVNGAAVSARDVPVRDGVMHILDEVLLPPPAPPLLSSTSSSGRIGVEELKRRLARFIEVGYEGGWSEEL